MDQSCQRSSGRALRDVPGSRSASPRWHRAPGRGGGKHLRERRSMMRTLLGLLLASVMVVGSGCATAEKMEGKDQPPASVNVTGNWSGTWSYERQSLGGGTLSGNF